MTYVQALLGKIAEECNEAGQRALKAQKFGLSQTQPGFTEDNEVRLRGELNDIRVAIKMLEDYTGADLHTLTLEDAVLRVERVNKYTKLSQDLGLTGPA